MNTFHLVPQQVPEFIQAEYPAFVEFLKAYYRWYDEEYSIGKIQKLTDIDKTIDAFLVHFRSQLDVHGVFKDINDPIFIRNIKDLYAAKGSDDSYNFFFKVVYGKESSVFHPWDVTLKPSEGKWQQDTAVSIRVLRGDVNSLPGNSVYVIDAAGVKYKTDVKLATLRPDNTLYELIIDRFSCGPVQFVRVESLDGVFAASIVNTTVKAIVEKPGSGFEVGQIFYINSYGGSGTVIKVKSVNSAGGITAVEIIGFGTGYTSNFNVQITSSSALRPATLKNKITINNLQYEAGDAVDAQNETGVVIKHSYSSLAQKYMDPTYVGSIVGEIQTQDGVLYYGTDYAQIRFNVGCVYRYPGFYVSSDSLLGDQAFIHDSYYYQIYSYETVVEENIKRYGELLRSNLHPAGSQHFGKYLITNQFKIDPVGVLTLNVIQKPGGTIKDLARVEDGTITFGVDKYLPENVVSVGDFGGIYPIGDEENNYVEILPEQYWQAGYLEGEIQFNDN
jgi:hypothetical protein